MRGLWLMIQLPSFSGMHCWLVWYHWLYSSEPTLLLSRNNIISTTSKIELILCTQIRLQSVAIQFGKHLQQFHSGSHTMSQLRTTYCSEMKTASGLKVQPPLLSGECHLLCLQMLLLVVWGSDRCTLWYIRNNTVRYNNAAITLWSMSSADIRSNIVNNNRGVGIEGTAAEISVYGSRFDSKISNNTVNGNGGGGYKLLILTTLWFQAMHLTATRALGSSF